MNPRHGEGAAPQRRPSPTQLVTHPQRTARPRHVVVETEVYPPAGRRTLPAAAVRCPACHGIHLHRFADPAELGMVRGSCGARYRLKVADPSEVRWSA